MTEFSITERSPLVGFFIPTGISMPLAVRWKKTAHTDGYEVWRSENGKPFTCVKRITNGKTQNFTDTGLKKGVTYTYAIKSYRINSLKKKIYGDIFTQTKLKTIKYS